MNLSVKNMIFAFVAGLVVFSLIMTALCVGMFNSEIEGAKNVEGMQAETIETVTLDKTIVFKVEKSEGINFIVLAMIDNNSKKILLTPVYGDYLMPYKNALSYVSNVYLELGDGMLPEMVKAFSGLAVSDTAMRSVENVVNYEGFKSALLSDFSSEISANGDISEYGIEDFTLVLKENQTENTHEKIKQIDTEKSVEKFRTILGKK